ncbi:MULTISPECIES: DUF4268 domain-containing protein [unclassified Leeuwenhoekiella]|uniref:DUF4268 domain-containing protein n=1 Tax=unclassified Leeuwenhoekiella TaxID=2615029 RepID=UPI000C40FCBF|nr:MULTISPECIES: DUF4268 domain-containing protein [unclassified Leeuwenhoekiella]MAW94778.1 hypothetical protein [Leeuwenhoekiella sp.]MBA79497.1 hypothetical protein [Leeuwenhoekiella sp.]|tara:strand:+ start:1913 stop:2341 length:429 start_codon:yes stop_codon:yes gene_type:complete
MFSKEESKQIRQDFWIFFGKRYPRKWLLYDTKVKEINLKFSFDNQKSQVSFDIETHDELIREYYFEKFESLENLLKAEISEEIILEQDYLRSSGKIISRIYLEKTGVNIHNKTHWPEVFDFFNENMQKFELFWYEYQDFITS